MRLTIFKVVHMGNKGCGYAIFCKNKDRLILVHVFVKLWRVKYGLQRQKKLDEGANDSTLSHTNED
ncbi:hypothetical protein GSM42_01605 [Shimazuella sp. KC615]|uniref:Uncharacterized protein n=1 Tax=Shimazuella alba TaxID=2690964 RepID=A0A6I4VPZ0_9BACL|nr:hypothetical protein [Shimazuella alba]